MHHGARCERALSARPDQGPVEGRAYQPALGVGLHLRLNLEELVLFRLRQDTFARRLVGWRFSRAMRTDFVLDAFEQVNCTLASPCA